ncbi:RHS repeat-associated core domain-containing protein [Pseudomonas sp.]|uniref:RHS repeat-associated core domain-containing protein n=1 Tax=Pseudomonas sp. TaxID=306 RepID=UPI001B138927|nr:RHS repeat-associated core domain-containing protein [Pseudomonas sp.]MBO9550127.1 RHS repeat-associated core domain-containing protein [Pseudomonas sp.]
MPSALESSETFQRDQEKLQNTSHSNHCYSAYGFYGHSALSTGLAFAGQFLDIKSGCYLLGRGHRAYSPQRMRFNQPDEASPFGRGGVNAYMYCQGDPINRIDPTGRFGEWLMNMLDDGFPRARTGRPPVLVEQISQQTPTGTEFARVRHRNHTIIEISREQDSFQRVSPQPRSSQPSVIFNELTSPRTLDRLSQIGRQVPNEISASTSHIWPMSQVGPALYLESSLRGAQALAPAIGVLPAGLVAITGSMSTVILMTPLGTEFIRRPAQTLQLIRQYPQRALDLMLDL